MALHHIIDIKTALHDLYRLLKPNGKLCIIDLNEEDGRFHQSEKDFKGHNGFNQNQLKKVLNTVGYRMVSSYTFYEGQKTISEDNVDYSLFIMVGK